MMKVLQREELNPCTVKLTVEVERDEVREAMDVVMRRLAKELRVPGFRPGKAPRHMVEQFVQRDVVFQRTAEFLLPKAYQEAVEAEGLEPYGAPSLELTRLDDESPCEFTAKVPLRPHVELGEYKGLLAERPDPVPHDEEVERELLEMRRRRATRTRVERPAQHNDMAVIRLTPERSEGKRFMVVVGATFPQLDQQIAGMSPGDTKSTTLTYPENFEEADWAGKPMDTEIELVEVSTLDIPEADDEFAKQLGAEDLADLKDRVKRSIGARKLAYSNEVVVEQLLRKLVENSTVDIPDTMWEPVAERQIEDIETEQARRNRTIETYASERSLTVEQLKEAVRQDAQTQVKRALLVREIAEKEDILLSEDDIDAQIQRIANRAGVTFDAAKREMERQDGMDEIRFRALFRKVTQLLEEHGEIVTVESPAHMG